MIIAKYGATGIQWLSYDNLEVGIQEFIKKFNFKPTFFVVGVSSQGIINAIRIGEAVNSSGLGGFDLRFVYDRSLEDGRFYLLSINNDEAYQYVM